MSGQKKGGAAKRPWACTSVTPEIESPAINVSEEEVVVAEEAVVVAAQP
jgi:hypothetical protein